MFSSVGSQPISSRWKVFVWFQHMYYTSSFFKGTVLRPNNEDWRGIWSKKLTDFFPWKNKLFWLVWCCFNSICIDNLIYFHDSLQSTSIPNLWHCQSFCKPPLFILQLTFSKKPPFRFLHPFFYPFWLNFIFPASIIFLSRFFAVWLAGSLYILLY